MKKYFALLSLGIFFTATAQPIIATMNQYIQNASQCQDVDCARQNINAIDSQIVALIGERLAFVKRVAELKPPATSREQREPDLETLTRIGQQAQAVGYSPLIARSVFTSILLQSNLEQVRSYQLLR